MPSDFRNHFQRISLPAWNANRVLLASTFIVGILLGAMATPSLAGPPAWFEQKVAASDGGVDHSFSYAVAISGDTAVIGAPDAGTGGSGAAYVFERHGETWSEAQILTTAETEAGAGFGFSVALSQGRIVIGAPYATVGGNGGQGAAYVFVEDAGVWGQSQMLTADDGGVSNNFGWSVAIDGDNAVISAPAAPVGANALQGKAYIFHADAGNFIQGPTLLADDGTAFASFGYSVAIDGVTAVIGAQGVDSYFGAAYVFDGADAWTQSGRLSPDDGTPLEFFGISVDVSGAVAIVGAYYQDVGDNDHQGAAYLFRNEGGTWTQSQKLTASDGAANDRFGLAVALDGSTAIVGAYIADVAGNVDQGAAYVFEASEGIFAEQAKLTASDGIAEAHYGNAVAVHDGTALIGDSAATVAGNVGQGAAYFYSAPVADRIFQSGFDFVP